MIYIYFFILSEERESSDKAVETSEPKRHIMTLTEETALKIDIPTEDTMRTKTGHIMTLRTREDTSKTPRRHMIFISVANDINLNVHGSLMKRV